MTATPAKAGYPIEGGALDMLVDVAVDFPAVEIDRKPLNVALVIDRSGSMSGEPLESAKAAARHVVTMLMPGDWVSVVAYDDSVLVPVRCVRVGEDRRKIVAAIARIQVGGSTALHAGWVEGVSQVLSCPAADTVARVVLLSDGCANTGIRDAASIALDVSAATGQGVTTTALGLGRHYDEALMRAVADAGHGNFEFIEDPSQVVTIFERELAGLSALRGRAVRLRTASHRGARLEHVGAGLGSDERGLMLPDLVAGLPLELLVTVHCDPHARTPTLVLTWDDLLTGAREEARLKVAVEKVDRATFEALPTEPRVAAMRVMLDIAAQKAAIAEDARRRDFAAATSRLESIASAIAVLPEGDERERELHEHQRLFHFVTSRDAEMASRSSEKFSFDRTRSRGESKMEAMAWFEAEARQKKLAFAREASASRPSVAGGDGPASHGRGNGGPASRAAHGQGAPYERTLNGPTGATVRVQVVMGDITDERLDAIVTSTNKGLFGTQGVDGAVHRRGGPELTAAARRIGVVELGHAVFTHGFDLPARYVIHTSTSPWSATGRELETLARCYAASLTLAHDLGVRTIAFPAIGTGTYGYPPEEAAQVAVESVMAWLTQRGSLDLVRFVLFDAASADTYRRVLQDWGVVKGD
jgi:Ca-activated chloride channel homolog